MAKKKKRVSIAPDAESSRAGAELHHVEGPERAPDAEVGGDDWGGSAIWGGGKKKEKKKKWGIEHDRLPEPELKLGVEDAAIREETPVSPYEVEEPGKVDWGMPSWWKAERKKREDKRKSEVYEVTEEQRRDTEEKLVTSSEPASGNKTGSNFDGWGSLEEKNYGSVNEANPDPDDDWYWRGAVSKKDRKGEGTRKKPVHQSEESGEEPGEVKDQMDEAKAIEATSTMERNDAEQSQSSSPGDHVESLMQAYEEREHEQENEQEAEAEADPSKSTPQPMSEGGDVKESQTEKFDDWDSGWRTFALGKKKKKGKGKNPDVERTEDQSIEKVPEPDEYIAKENETEKNYKGKKATVEDAEDDEEMPPVDPFNGLSKSQKKKLTQKMQQAEAKAKKEEEEDGRTSSFGRAYLSNKQPLDTISESAASFASDRATTFPIGKNHAGIEKPDNTINYHGSGSGTHAMSQRSSSSGVQVSASTLDEYTDDDDDWDLIDEDLSPRRPSPRRPSPRRRSSRRASPRNEYALRSNASEALDDYPGYMPTQPVQYQHEPLDTYGYADPGLRPFGFEPLKGRYPSGYPYSPPSGTYGAQYSAPPLPPPPPRFDQSGQYPSGYPYSPPSGTYGPQYSAPPPPPPRFDQSGKRHTWAPPTPLPLPTPNTSIPLKVAPDPQDSQSAEPMRIISDDEENELGSTSRRYRDSKSWKWKREGRHPRLRAFNYEHGHWSGARAKRDPNDPKCHPYTVPFSDHGEPLSVHVKINGPDKKKLLEKSSTGLWLWPEVHSTVERKAKLLNIIGAKRWFDSESQHTLDLTCAPGPDDEKGRANTTKWLHVKRQHLDFDEFRAIVLSVPNLSRDWSIVLLSLLKRIRTLHYDQSTDRFFPWTLRADSAELGLSGTGGKTLSATSISFPYFELGPVLGHGPKNTDYQYPIMSLYEWDDRFESVKEWDSEQSFRLMNDGAADKDSIIYVPHVWAITFGDTIITYGPVSFGDLEKQDSIHVLEPDPKAPIRASSIEVFDQQGLQFALSLSQCRTFFALKQSIKIRYLASVQGLLDDIDIVTGDAQTLDGEKWISLLQHNSSDVIRVHLRRKEVQTSSVATSGPGIQNQVATIPKAGALASTLGNTSEQIAIQSHAGMHANEEHDSDSSSDTEYLLKERTNNAMALIKIPQRPSLKPALQNKGELVLYDRKASVRHEPSMPASSKAPQQDNLKLSASTSLVLFDDMSRRREKLKEKGVIVFDPTTLDSSPEVYSPPKTVVRFRLPPTRADATSEHRSTHSREISPNPSIADAAEEQTRSVVINDTEKFSRKSQISIPHFLSWATSQENIDDVISSESSVESIVKILGMVHDTLQTTRPSRHSRTYRRSKEVAQAELEAVFPPLKAVTSDAANPSGKSPKHDDSNSKHPLLVADYSEDDRVRASELEACNKKLEILHRYFHGFLSLYVPLTSPSVSDHPIVLKCWGAFETILAIITFTIQDEAFALRYKDPEWWMIKDPSPLGILSNQKKPRVSWKDCELCRNSTRYLTVRDAAWHVQSYHYDRPKDGEDGPDIHALVIWLRNDIQYYADTRIELYTNYLDHMLEPLEEVYKKGRGIWDGVASDNSSMPSGFMLPKSLVNAFENAVLLLVCAAKAFPLLSRCSDPMNKDLPDGNPAAKKERELLATTGKDIIHFGNRTKECMNKAEHDIMLGAYTDIDTETVSYDTVGPEYILATIMTTLVNKPLHADDPIDLVYASFYRRLHRDAIKHPRTRILGQIWRMREELNLITSINTQHQDLLKNYLRILEPCTFRATTLLRAARFKVEAPFLDLQLRKSHAVRLRLSDLDSRLEDVSDHVSRMLEIQQENNGNAIIVFTIVTIIFLPLSWATSYLGMNTVDIRNLEKGQWVFWSMALPVTGFVIGLAVLVVLKGEGIREFFIRREGVRERRRLGSSGMAVKRRLSTRVTGGSVVRKHSVLEPGQGHLWGGFRRRPTTVRGEGEV
ncbi:hypothetical protein CC80DRAFT_597741 [Byssothecium circinans]|uniref:Cora-domain-containing protein n=1 Tax=Byssothecium circinans TaxID=147558 RepID=A0A6A5TQ91_9PLEO|nr:hypothetical protein CC80DRAFT_597741 [Byssothecium circinans]